MRLSIYKTQKVVFLFDLLKCLYNLTFMSEKQKHPGKTFKAILRVKGVSQVNAALRLKMTESRIGELCRGEKRVNTELAIKLSYLLPKTTSEEWLSLQSKYDLSCIAQVRKEILRTEVIPLES